MAGGESPKRCEISQLSNLSGGVRIHRGQRNQYARGRASEEAVRAVAVATAAESIHPGWPSAPRVSWEPVGEGTAARIATESVRFASFSWPCRHCRGSWGRGCLTRQPSGNGAYIGVCGAQVKQIPSGGLPSVCLAEYLDHEVMPIERGTACG